MQAKQKRRLERLLLGLLLIGMLSLGQGGGSVYAFPVKLAKLSYYQAGYEKHIFLVGDVHRYQNEMSSEGRASLKAMDGFLSALAHSRHYSARVPLIWEASSRTVAKSQSPLYLRQKAKELAGKGQGAGRLDFIAADSLREHDYRLKKFMLDLTYRPQKARQQLAVAAERLRLAQQIKATLLVRGRRVFAAQMAKESIKTLPIHIRGALQENILWYHEEVSHIKKSLEMSLPSLLSHRSFVDDYKKILIRATEDVELLINLFARGEKIVVIYAGNGHIRRLQAYLQVLGFGKEFEVEGQAYLKPSDFQRFLQIYDTATWLVNMAPMV